MSHRTQSSPCGIIPARAGFTIESSENSSQKRDHPRSRGVYRGLVHDGAPGPGSSPLARGLHAPVGESIRFCRIIPARAGFTSTTRSARGADRDHPRSRGVYTASALRRPGCQGSSPLARGLPSWFVSIQSRIGIIPARAGFTRLLCALFFIRGDHPRSRGVYRIQTVATTPATGSSPLARGLLKTLDHASHRRGIIPARAGFTRLSSLVLRIGRDHPRSRGVYLNHSHDRRYHGGSSPLARGLRLGTARGVRSRRIIPARAGFTTSRR